MIRQERKNMIEFIQRTKEMTKDQLMFMTDAEIEHIYSITYDQFELMAE